MSAGTLIDGVLTVGGYRTLDVSYLLGENMASEPISQARLRLDEK
jgi:hypothetical protein